MGRNRRIIISVILKLRAMSVFALMAFVLCGMIFSSRTARGENHTIPTIFFVIAGDASYKQVIREDNKAEVKSGLQYEILKEVQSAVRVNDSLNAVLVFDAPNAEVSFVQFFKCGELNLQKEIADDITDPHTLADILKDGYDRLPSNHYYFMVWGFSIPPYPNRPYDMSEPSKFFSFENIKQSFLEAESYRENRKFDSVILSTCYNSSFEALLFLGAFTRSIVATEIYLYHRGFPVELLALLSGEDGLDQELIKIHRFIIQKLDEWIPKGPATGNPVLDISVSVMNTEGYWDLFDTLDNVFFELGDQIHRGEKWDQIGTAFKKSLLRKSRGQVFDEMWVDVHTLMHELGKSSGSLDKILFLHQAPLETNIQGMNIYLPVFTYKSLKEFQKKLAASYFRGTALVYFIDALEKKYFEIFGAHREDQLPKDLRTLVPYFENGRIDPAVVRDYRSGKSIEIDQAFSGVLDGQGKYIGRRGSHVLILPSGQRLQLRSQDIDLNRWISPQLRSYDIKGSVRLESGALSDERGAALFVESIKLP